MNEQKQPSTWEKIKKVAIIALATLGVLFIILMLIPSDDEDDEEEDYVAQETVEEDEDEEIEANVASDSSSSDSNASTSNAMAEASGDAQEEEESADEDSSKTGNTVAVNIPDSELSSSTLKFKTSTLDGKVVSQDVFKDYDITIVHVWGTYCGPCIEEMPEYAELYDSLPDNINIVGVVVDVYDGIDNNVSDANDILSSAGAKFMNLRTSDEVYEITEAFQYVPSSFLVDSEGHVIGKLMDGASCSETKSRLSEYIE